MKKFTALCVMMLVAITMNAQAQKVQHELSVSYGFLTKSNINNDYGAQYLESKNTVVGKTSGTYSGSINLQYIYYANDKLGFGLGLGYEHLTYKIKYIQDPFSRSTGSANDKFYTVMPMAKYNWKRGNMLRLYSKVAIGMCINKVSSFTNNVSFAYHASVIGLEVGTKICGFAELGYGSQGVIQAGLKYRFRNAY